MTIRWFPNVQISKRGVLFLALLLLCPLILFDAPAAQRQRATPQKQAVYISLADARPVLSALDEILPAELKGKTQQQLAALWPSWVKQRDNEIRARLAQGDADSLINFLLFGTSFTKQPRVALDQIGRLKSLGQATPGAQPDEVEQLHRLVSARINDLLQSLNSPGGNERLLFARRIKMCLEKY